MFIEQNKVEVMLFVFGRNKGLELSDYDISFFISFQSHGDLLLEYNNGSFVVQQTLTPLQTCVRLFRLTSYYLLGWEWEWINQVLFLQVILLYLQVDEFN